MHGAVVVSGSKPRKVMHKRRLAVGAAACPGPLPCTGQHIEGLAHVRLATPALDAPVLAPSRVIVPATTIAVFAPRAPVPYAAFMSISAEFSSAPNTSA